MRHMPKTRLAVYLLATYIVFFVGACVTTRKQALKCGALYADQGHNYQGWVGCPDWPLGGTTVPRPPKP